MNFIELGADNIRNRGLQVPGDMLRSGLYQLELASGLRYIGQTSDIVVRIGGHRRTYDDISRIAFCSLPVEEIETGFAELCRTSGARLSGTRPESTRRGREIEANDPVFERIRWIEENVAPGEHERSLPNEEQRARTRPLFDRLAAHSDFDLLAKLSATYLDRVVPCPPVTERRNWVVTSMPSTARTRVWHRLLCLSINNVEALTIGEQFDGERWIVAGFMSAAHIGEDSHTFLPARARHKGAFLAPAYYQTVGDVTQIGFDSLEALNLLLDDDNVLDAVGSLVMRLMRRGRGMYGRFHDYNLADLLIKPTQPGSGVGDW